MSDRIERAAAFLDRHDGLMTAVVTTVVVVSALIVCWCYGYHWPPMLFLVAPVSFGTFGLLLGLQGVLRLMVRLKTWREKRHYKMQNIYTVFDNQGDFCDVSSRFCGRDLAKRLSSFIKEHKPTGDLEQILKLVKGRVDAYAKDENRARGSLGVLNKAFAAHKKAGLLPSAEMRKAAKEFWRINERGLTLGEEIEVLLAAAERSVNIEKVMGTSPMPDLFAESIPESISALVAVTQERAENLEDAYKEVEGYLGGLELESENE